VDRKPITRNGRLQHLSQFDLRWANTKINSTLDPNTTYNDQAVQDGTTYYYVTTAVDGQGMESTYSNEASAFLP